MGRQDYIINGVLIIVYNANDNHSSKSLLFSGLQ